MRWRLASIGLIGWFGIGALTLGWFVIGDASWGFDCDGNRDADIGSSSGCTRTIFPNLIYAETEFLGLELLIHWVHVILPLAIGLSLVLAATALRSAGLLALSLALLLLLMTMSVAYAHLSDIAWQPDPVWVVLLVVLAAGLIAYLVQSLWRLRGDLE